MTNTNHTITNTNPFTTFPCYVIVFECGGYIIDNVYPHSNDNPIGVNHPSLFGDGDYACTCGNTIAIECFVVTNDVKSIYVGIDVGDCGYACEPITSFNVNDDGSLTLMDGNCECETNHGEIMCGGEQNNDGCDINVATIFTPIYSQSNDDVLYMNAPFCLTCWKQCWDME